MSKESKINKPPLGDSVTTQGTLKNHPTIPNPSQENHSDNPPKQLSPNLGAALDYARRGWPVFPVHTSLQGEVMK